MVGHKLPLRRKRAITEQQEWQLEIYNQNKKFGSHHTEFSAERAQSQRASSLEQISIFVIGVRCSIVPSHTIYNTYGWAYDVSNQNPRWTEISNISLFLHTI